MIAVDAAVIEVAMTMKTSRVTRVCPDSSQIPFFPLIILFVLFIFKNLNYLVPITVFMIFVSGPWVRVILLVTL